MGFDLQPASLATRLAGQCQPHKTYPQLQKTEDREGPSLECTIAERGVLGAVPQAPARDQQLHLWFSL
eukprot:scaffold67021_cov15-Tisochrysis_lutea.AAC.1